VNVGDHFMSAPGAANGIIAILAPIALDISGSGIKAAQVAFDHDPAPVGQAPPVVEVDAALSFHVSGGDTGDLINLLFGMGDPDQIGNPDIMPSGSLDVRLTGGGGGDTISGMLWLDPHSAGQVTAAVFGGAGDDDLRLDVFGINNPAILTALINGGKGSNTAHHTANARVVNCGMVYLDS
jgi:hypothetical protein